MTTNDFKILLDKAKLSKKDFSKLTSIAYGTIGNWNDDTRPIPSWVESWLENYIKAKDIETVANILKPYIKEDK